MSISIKRITTAIELGNGPTMASQFRVSFAFPQALKTAHEGFKSSEISVLCQSVSLPGTQVATTELPVYGPPLKMPYGLIYQDLNVSFLCTNNMAQRKVFEEWRRIIVDPTTNYVNYYDTYVGNLIVEKLNQKGNVVHTVLFEDVFPVAIFEQELSSNNNDWLKLSIQFSYRRWRTRMDQAAAKRGGYPEGEIPETPGTEEYPHDVFKDTKAPQVPKFQP